MRSSVNTVLATFEDPLVIVEDDTWQLPHRIITERINPFRSRTHTTRTHSRKTNESREEKEKKAHSSNLLRIWERATSDHYDTCCLRQTTVFAPFVTYIVSSFFLSLSLSRRVRKDYRGYPHHRRREIPRNTATYKCFSATRVFSCVAGTREFRSIALVRVTRADSFGMIG